jgi:integrase
MSIRWDTRNKRWRFEFDRFIAARRHRLSRLLPKGWTKAKAEEYDQRETGRLVEVATGGRSDSLIDKAVLLYLMDKQHLKSLKSAEQHLNEIRWAYEGKPLSELPAVAREVAAARDGQRKGKVLSDATIRNRLALLKAACRWGWKRHGLCASDPTAKMVLPTVRNERHTYLTRQQMLQACRACTHWETQIAIRVAFYTGMRLGELLKVKPEGDLLVLHDTKNGDRRAIPAHPKIRHLMPRLPLASPKITIQRAWERARAEVGLNDFHFHDLRHSAASEMVNAGVDLFVVGKVLGHRDSRSTERYSHLTAGKLAEAVANIGRTRA